MNRFLIAAAALSLLAGPALAQSDTTTETTRTITAPAPLYPVPPAAPVDSSSSYKSSTVTHSDNGYERKDTSATKEIAPDGSTSTTHKVIEQETH
jgi:hypothetical protein